MDVKSHWDLEISVEQFGKLLSGNIFRQFGKLPYEKRLPRFDVDLPETTTKEKK